MPSTFEPIVVNGIELHHTFRGHNLEIEVYTYQDGPTTYSLYKRKDAGAWRCDAMNAHHWEDIHLDADPADLEAMLEAFAAVIARRGGGAAG